MTSEVTDTSGLIDPEAFAFRSGALWTSLDDVSENARFCRQTGQAVGDASSAVYSAWAGLRESYQAPEGEDLYAKMDPVKASGDQEWDILDQAGGFMDAYVEELMPARQKLSVLEAEAQELRTRVAGGVRLTAQEAALTLRPPSPGNEHLSWAAWDTLRREGGRTPWQHHQPSIDSNFLLVSQALDLMEQIRQAGLDLAQGLDGLDPGTPLTPAASEYGWGPYAPGVQAPGWRFRQAPAADVSGFAPGQDVLGGTADQVRAWWDALTPAQRSALITAMPLVIGNLNGVPLKYRAEANTINLTGEIANLRAEQARIDQEMAAVQAQRFGRGNPMQIAAELLRLKAERDRLDEPIREYEHYLHLRTPQNEYDENGRRTTRTNVEVVAFDPTAHSIATYHGRYDENGDISANVENLGVYVPGTKTRTDNFNGADARAYNLYVGSNAEKFGPGRTAMIAWAGGEFPTSIPEAINGKYAEDLGPKLRDFVAAVDTRPDSSALAIDGHSYGGLTVARAEAAGLAADRVMYTSSAGLGDGVHSVTEFPNTGDVPHYSMIGRGDSVVGLVQQDPFGVHGDAPPYVEHITRLETGFQEDGDTSSGTIEETGPFKQHSSVYDVGSTAFNGHVGFFTGTQVELFSQNQTIGTRYGGVEWVDGIKHPDYEATMIDVSEQEKQ
ncbi:alpha/beta hydrolase family protein [Promicromonospora sp. AC04]|uniref:alpha/beta hydrolase n=1 Tax=Promicromonospora sp. AC04 TaxID=2135723 RepID=UPI000D35DEE5|nr:alpha/beta hydrolase [Promicromonospora sp. AC04]PUB31510.1 alpha/beta hydrolase family protein [Promicromonospora sp. AC04]